MHGDISARLLARRNLLIAFLVLVSLALGFISGRFSLRPNQFEKFNGQKVILSGFICSDVLEQENKTKEFEVCFDRAYSQRILISTFSRDSYFYGDGLYIIGKIKIPNSSGKFDYQKYLQSKNIFAQMYSPQAFIIDRQIHNPIIYYSLRLKHLIYNRFFARLSKLKAALLVALIIGQKDLLPVDVIAAFNAAGVAHLIAVSGYILTLTLAFGAYLKTYIGRVNAFIFCALVAMLYIIMADFSAGVIRAAIMSAVLMLGKNFGKQYSLLPALALTAALLVFANPLIIKYDIGFMLSFLSILGIICFVPLLNAALRFVPKTLGIRNIFSVTIAAQLITVPITAYYFSQLSLIAPLTNLLIIPVIELCLVLGYLLCLPLVSFAAAALVTIPLNYILVIVSVFASFKFSTLIITINWQAMLGIYALESAAYLAASRLLKDRILFDKMP